MSPSLVQPDASSGTSNLHPPPPPACPPPLLTTDQILHLAHQGHLPLPLPPSLRCLYNRLYAATSRFFSLPTSEKSALYPPTGVNKTELGYVDLHGEKEYLSFRALSPHYASNFQSDSHSDSDYNSKSDYEYELDGAVVSREVERMSELVWRETYLLLYRVLADLAWGLGLEKGHEAWDAVVDGVCPMPRRLEEATPTLLRMFRYAPNTGTADAHTDLGLLTLCVCEGEGLQVLMRRDEEEQNEDDEREERSGRRSAVVEEGEWVQYREPTLLVGQTLRMLTAGQVRAGVHRVVGNPNGRGSFVYALRPNTKHEVDLRDFFFPGETPDDVAMNGNGTDGKVHLGKFWRRIWKGAYNVNAPKAVREKQKDRLRAERESAMDKGDGLVDREEEEDGPDDVTNSIAALTA